MSRAPLLTLAFVALLASAASADVVFLKGGQRLEGEITPKGNGFEIKNEFGSWTFTKDEVVKIVESYDKIVAKGDAMRQQARMLYDEALPLVDTDTKAANAKLRQGLELLRKIADLYNEALETYSDPKYGNLQKVVVTIFQEMRLYRDKIHSELAPVVVAKPEPPPTPPPVATVKGPVKRPVIDPNVYLPKAMAGDVEAMFVLGAFYDEKTWNSADGQKWLRAAADKGHARAQDRVGTLYALGKGVKQDYKEAQRWYQMAEKANLPLARYHLGLMEWQGNLGPRSLEKAYAWCEKGAEGLSDAAGKGDVEAQLALAWMFQEGMGKAQDHAKALDYYRDAAESEYGPAENQLAIVYRDGRAGDKNPAEASKMFQKAAEAGYAEAQVNFGELFDEYTGKKMAGPKDFGRAQQWYQKAAEQGHGRALYRLGLIQLDGKGVAKNAAEAVKLLKQALALATDDYLRIVLNDLGYVYEKGQGVKADATEAMKNYKLAADLGSMEAQYNLGSISLEKNNEKDAYKWYVMAAKQGHALAQNNLGAFYAQGKTVKKNLDEAEKWFLMAAQQGDATAAENLKKLQKERPKK
jgi:TPR repeat protein